MATKQSSHGRAPRGTISALPSGALRVRVCAGTDPVSGKAHYLRETVPVRPKAEKQAETVRTRLLGEVGEGCQPKTSATAEQLMDRYLEVLHVEAARLGVPARSTSLGTSSWAVRHGALSFSQFR